MKSGKRQQRDALDRAAIFLSGLCLLHCIAVPLALVLGPLLGGWLQNTETQVHWVLLALALPISAIALQRGFRRHHSWLTIILGYTGLLLMFIGVSHWLGEAWEIALTVTGVSLLLMAHVRNLFAAHAHA